MIVLQARYKFNFSTLYPVTPGVTKWSELIDNIKKKYDLSKELKIFLTYLDPDNDTVGVCCDHQMNEMFACLKGKSLIKIRIHNLDPQNIGVALDNVPPVWGSSLTRNPPAPESTVLTSTRIDSPKPPSSANSSRPTTASNPTRPSSASAPAKPTAATNASTSTQTPAVIPTSTANAGTGTTSEIEITLNPSASASNAKPQAADTKTSSGSKIEFGDVTITSNNNIEVIDAKIKTNAKPDPIKPPAPKADSGSGAAPSATTAKAESSSSAPQKPSPSAVNVVTETKITETTTSSSSKPKPEEKSKIESVSTTTITETTNTQPSVQISTQKMEQYVDKISKLSTEKNNVIIDKIDTVFDTLDKNITSISKEFEIRLKLLEERIANSSSSKILSQSKDQTPKSDTKPTAPQTTITSTIKVTTESDKNKENALVITTVEEKKTSVPANKPQDKPASKTEQNPSSDPVPAKASSPSSNNKPSAPKDSATPDSSSDKPKTSAPAKDSNSAGPSTSTKTDDTPTPKPDAKPKSGANSKSDPKPKPSENKSQANPIADKPKTESVTVTVSDNSVEVERVSSDGKSKPAKDSSFTYSEKDKLVVDSGSKGPGNSYKTIHGSVFDKELNVEKKIYSHEEFWTFGPNSKMYPSSFAFPLDPSYKFSFESDYFGNKSALPKPSSTDFASHQHHGKARKDRHSNSFF
ncbi:hypothetical protein AYI68_g656, partial [Smittium mucronatum]